MVNLDKYEDKFEDTVEKVTKKAKKKNKLLKTSPSKVKRVVDHFL